MPRLTIEQIAALAGVSRSTVSRVLNNHPNVRRAVRERILHVIDEHKYAPQAAARNLARRRTNVIAFFIPRTTAHVFSNPFFPLIIQGITEVCAARGYILLLSIVSGNLEQDFVRILRGGHCDGVIMHAADVDDPVLPRLMAEGTPLVQIGRHPYFQTLSWISVANREGAHAAVAHLLTLGHRRIATIAGPLHEAAALDRRDGYKQALLEADVPLAPALFVEGDWTEQSGYSAMRRLLARTPYPTAVFAANDMMAVGALRAIDEAQLSVPHDMALVGFDDLPVAAFTTPPLTTVRQPVYEMGVAAATLLADRLEHPSQEPVHRDFPTTLIIRGTCRTAPAVADGYEGRPAPATRPLDHTPASVAPVVAVEDVGWQDERG